MRLINKQAESDIFIKNSNILLNKYSRLKDWIIKKSFVVEMGNNCERYIKVSDWFDTHENTYLYLRQPDIESVDTKFIETHQRIIADMPDIVLPPEKINNQSKIFEDRYYLQKKPTMLHIRILDTHYAISGFTTPAVALAEFIQWNPNIKRFFFTENEVNFLSFPECEHSCIISGKGYGVNLFKLVPWLHDKEIYYWGDIDTHGFNILSIARSFLPQTKSFLMTEEILLSHKSLWVHEEKQATNKIDHLTQEEFNVVCKLQADYYGEKTRPQQERIGFTYVNEFFKSPFLILTEHNGCQHQYVYFFILLINSGLSGANNLISKNEKCDYIIIDVICGKFKTI